MNPIIYSTNGLSQYNSDNRFKNLQGQGMTIAVVDTGIDLNHPWFGPDNNHDGVSDRIVARNIDFGSTDDNSQDISGHGTAVAGVIAAVARGVDILPVQISTPNGNTSTTAIFTDALNWVAENKARYDVVSVNVSYGDAKNWQINDDFVLLGNEYYADAVSGISENGMSFFAATGNSYDYYQVPGAQSFAAHYSTIGVAATNSNGLTETNDLWAKSQRRSDAIAAPGVGITTARLNGDTANWSGTSFATPFVAACSVLLQDVSEEYLGRRLEQEELRSIIFSTADTMPNGYKEFDLFGAAEEIYRRGGGTNPPVDNPGPVGSFTPDLSEVRAYGQNNYWNPTSTSRALANTNPDAISISYGAAVAVEFDQEINEDSLLSFQYRLSNPKASSAFNYGGIGFDNDLNFSKSWSKDALEFFSLNDNNNTGTLIDDYSYTGSGNWQTFNIPVGDYFTGEFNYLTMSNDTGLGEYRNISVTNVS